MSKPLYSGCEQDSVACKRTWSELASWTLHSAIAKKRNRRSTTSSWTVPSGRNRDTSYGCRMSQPPTSCGEWRKTCAAPPNSWQHVDWGSKHGWSTAEEEEVVWIERTQLEAILGSSPLWGWHLTTEKLRWSSSYRSTRELKVIGGGILTNMDQPENWRSLLEALLLTWINQRTEGHWWRYSYSYGSTRELKVIGGGTHSYESTRELKVIGGGILTHMDQLENWRSSVEVVLLIWINQRTEGHRWRYSYSYGSTRELKVIGGGTLAHTDQQEYWRSLLEALLLIWIKHTTEDH